MNSNIQIILNKHLNADNNIKILEIRKYTGYSFLSEILVISIF